MADYAPVAEGDLFQLGYVTTNLEDAVALWKARYGVSEWMTFDTRDRKPVDPKRPPIKVALGYLGDMMVELIEPVDPANLGIYGAALPVEGGTRLHHLGYLVDEDKFESLPAQFEALGIRMPVYMTGGPTLLYADTRADSGLYSEMVSRTEFMLGMFAQIPRAS